MATEIRPINSADVVRVAPAVRVALVVSEDPVEPVVRAALVVPEDPVVVRAALVVPEDPVEPVVRAALVVPEDLGEPAVRAALVVSESPAVPVALELVRAAAALVRGHPRARLAVALRTKSVIAAHRPDQVPLLEAEEDLAVAVVETTREPAVAEAVIAWEAAVTVAVAAAVTVAAAAVADIAVAEDAAAVAAAAAADAEDKRRIDGEKTMKTKRNTMTSSKMIALATAVLITAFLAPAFPAAPEKKETAAKQEERPGNSPTGAKAIRHAETGSRRPYSGSDEFRCRCRKGNSGSGR